MSGDLTARDDLMQQLAAMIAYAVVKAPTEIAQEVLASGLVVPTSDVLNLAQQWEQAPWSRRFDYADEYIAELRALTQPRGETA